jgi:hypothetical protein
MLTCGGCDLKLKDMGMGILKRYVRHEERENTLGELSIYKYFARIEHRN